MRAAAAVLLLAALAGAAARAQAAPDEASRGFFDRYVAMVERAQDGQPHWISPLITTTPRLMPPHSASLIFGYCAQRVADGWTVSRSRRCDSFT